MYKKNWKKQEKITEGKTHWILSNLIFFQNNRLFFILSRELADYNMAALQK